MAGVLEKALRDEGSEGFPFASIVASRSAVGAAARALVERARSKRAICCCWISAPWSDGYCSDITRTFVVGQGERRSSARSTTSCATANETRRSRRSGRNDRPGCRRHRARLH